MGTVIGMWICLILAIISFLVGITIEAEIIGGIIAFIFVILGMTIFNSAPNELKQAVFDLQEQERQEKLSNGCKCPKCGMYSGYKISLIRREGHYEKYGLESMLIGKTYECYNCSHLW